MAKAKTNAKSKAKPKAKSTAKPKPKTKPTKRERFRNFEIFFDSVVESGDLDATLTEYRDHGEVVYTYLRREAMEILNGEKVDAIVELARAKKLTNLDPARVQRLLYELAMDEPGVQVPPD